MTALAGAMTALALLAATSVGAQTALTPPIVEIRVHGNHSTPGDEIVALSGLAVGQPASDAVLETARAKLEASGRFETVTVRRLERSIDIPDDFMVLVEVRERPGVTPDHLTPGWARRLADGGMFIPVLRYDEGYGATYGLQLAVDGLFGGSSQLAVPATWGGERRIGVEGSRAFAGPIVSRYRRAPTCAAASIRRSSSSKSARGSSDASNGRSRQARASGWRLRTIACALPAPAMTWTASRRT